MSIVKDRKMIKKDPTLFTTESNSQIPQTLDEIPGIGKKIKAKILEYYQDESKAVKAVVQGYAGCVPGVTFRQAQKFALACQEVSLGISASDVLRTIDIQSIYENLLNIIKKYTKTDYSKEKLHLYHPLPSSHHPLISQRAQYFSKALNFVRQFRHVLEEKNLSRLLYKLDTFRQAEDLPKIGTRIILTDHSAVNEFVLENELNKICFYEQINLEKLKDVHQYFENYCKNFDVVIYCGLHGTELPGIDNLIILNTKEPSIQELVPENTIRVFAQNKDLIQAMIKIVVMLKGLKDLSLLNDFIDAFDLKKIKMIKENSSILDDEGDLIPGIDPELDNHRDIAENYVNYLAEAEGQCNEIIQKEIGERSVEIQGKQILDLFRSDLTIESVRNYIPPEVDDLIQETIQKELDNLAQLIKIPASESEHLQKLIPEIIEYPIEFNDEGIDRIQKYLSSRANTHKYFSMVKIAKELDETHHYLLDLHQTLLEFEFFYAIGQFGMDFNLNIPTLVQDSHGFLGQDLVNLELALTAKTNKQFDPIPIEYQIGDLLSPSSGATSANLALLTGSNSGGKTMCLMTVVESLLLAQMGFPSLGKLQFHPFDEFYYFKKSNGQISAGAFETTLVQFVQLAQSLKPKIIFADELESITEPNAAARVLAGIFSLLLDNPHNYGIFVTHLVDLIKQELENESEKTGNRIRIDGIEAKGLDDNLELIVDRNPKYNYIAKSTPELILTRLAKSGSEEQQQFFRQVLQRFQ